jgi:hypothetical protein
MDLDSEKLVKRYVWHDERTPYFTPPGKLSPVQARYELFAYAVFMTVLGGVLALAALSPGGPHAGAAVAPLYAFSVLCAAVVLGATRHLAAALWCGAAPLGVLAYFAAFGFQPGLDPADRVLLVVAVLAWLAYGARVVAIARTLR